ncbi:hypothetical protein BDF19DRAFT_443945 [Syncephalis fuscata]|nr:hypothetical protein BDF19DRAFT_443945 [Syncephalis fuscata]
MEAESLELEWITVKDMKSEAGLSNQYCQSLSTSRNVAVKRVLRGILRRSELSTDGPDKRGRIEFTDHTDTVYCQLVNGSSYCDSNTDWLARLEISEVRVPPSDLSALTVKELLMSGRLELSSMKILEALPPIQPLSTDEVSTLSQALPIYALWSPSINNTKSDSHNNNHNSNKNNNSSDLISLVARVNGKTVIHRPPNAPAWFLVNICNLKIGKQQQKQQQIVSILFYGNQLVNYYEQIPINCIMWFNQLHSSPSTNQSYRLYFYTEQSSVFIKRLSIDQVIQSKIYDKIDNNLNDLTTDTTPPKQKTANFHGKIKKVIDISLGIFELKENTSDTTTSTGISRILLLHTHDPSYYACNAYRPGYRITIYNGHISTVLYQIDGTILIFACSATSVTINDTGTDHVPLPLQLSSSDAWLFRICEQNRWNIHASLHIYTLYHLLNHKFPHAWHTQSMLITSSSSSVKGQLPPQEEEEEEEDQCSSGGLLWKLIDQCQLNGSGQSTLGTQRDYMKEGLCHKINCPAMVKELYVLTQTELPPPLDSSVLIGVLDGGPTGQLSLIDATGYLPVLLIKRDHSLQNSDIDDDSISKQQLPTHLLGHVWAITKFSVAFENWSSRRRQHPNDQPQVYIQFDLSEAFCVSQGVTPSIHSLLPFSNSSNSNNNNVPLYCFKASHIYPVRWEMALNGKGRRITNIEGYLQSVNIDTTTSPYALNQSTNTHNAVNGVMANIQLEETSLKWLPIFKPDYFYLLINPTTILASKFRFNQSSKLNCIYLSCSPDTVIHSLELSTSTIQHNSVKDLDNRLLEPLKVDMSQLAHLNSIMASPVLSINIYTNEAQDFIGTNYHRELINFTGIIQYRRLTQQESYQYRRGLTDTIDTSSTTTTTTTTTNNTTAYNFDKEKTLILRLVDRLDEQLYSLQLYLDFENGQRVMPAGLNVGDRICVRRVARKRIGSGELFYLAMACTDIALKDRLDAGMTAPFTPPVPKMIRLSDVLPILPFKALPGEMIQAVIQLQSLWRVQLWSTCISCGSFIKRGKCTTPYCFILSDDLSVAFEQSEFHGSAFLTITDGTHDTYLSLDDIDTVVQLLQLNALTIKRLRISTLHRGELSYDLKSELEATYGQITTQVDSISNEASNYLLDQPKHSDGLTNEQMLLYQCCERIKSYTGRLWMVGRIRKTRNSYNQDRILLGSRQPLIGDYYRQDTKIKQLRIHTLGWPKVTITGLRLEHRPISTEGRRLLQELTTEITKH